jgi:hypothetical protein
MGGPLLRRPGAAPFTSDSPRWDHWTFSWRVLPEAEVEAESVEPRDSGVDVFGGQSGGQVLIVVAEQFSLGGVVVGEHDRVVSDPDVAIESSENVGRRYAEPPLPFPLWSPYMAEAAAFAMRRGQVRGASPFKLSLLTLVLPRFLAIWESQAMHLTSGPHDDRRRCFFGRHGKTGHFANSPPKQV